MRLGIDFGTTRTVVAAVRDGRYPVAAFEMGRGFVDFVPGLAVGSNSEMVVGWDAVERLGGDAPSALRSIKRVVSSLSPDDTVAALAGQPTALDLTTEYLVRLRRMIVERSNLDVPPDEPLEAMVAVPAGASTRQRYLTMEAFNRAGFRVLGMVNEPTAAAIEYAHRTLGALSRRSPKRYVVIYDLGGGTFDTSAVSLAGRRYDLMATEGISELGGDDFDEAIFALVMESLGKDPEELGSVARARALEACREAKETLNPSSRRMLIDLSGVAEGLPAVTLETQQLYQRVEPLVRRTLALLDRVFSQLVEHGIDPNNPRELGAVYLVGGATAFPLVGKLLRENYGRKVQLATEPHAATAVGLAIAADPEAEIYVREAVTRHFGVWREGDGGRDKVFDPIFTKGSVSETGEHIAERRYSPVHGVGHLRYLECSEIGQFGQPGGDLMPWCDLFIPYVPELADRQDLPSLATTRYLPEGAEQVVERYAYQRDGRVRVAIENETRGFRREFVLGSPGAR
ncbi:MAG TPA: Hsp70 family protein [Polyangiaceae bacterium]|nr:Hsp70 family protein [Polyangiaceae bacterium]